MGVLSKKSKQIRAHETLKKKIGTDYDILLMEVLGIWRKLGRQLHVTLPRTRDTKLQTHSRELTKEVREFRPTPSKEYPMSLDDCCSMPRAQ